MFLDPYRFGGGSGGLDPYFSKVALLLHADTTTIGLDSSPNTKTSGTPSGTMTRSTLNPFYGPSAIENGNGGSGYMTFASHADFGLAGDFTIEMAVYVNSYAVGNQSLFNITNYSAGILWRIASAGTIEFFLLGTSHNFTHSMSAGAYHELAVTRQGSNLRHFIDGTLIGTAPGVSTASIPAGDIIIGASQHNTAGEYLNGYIDEFRLTDEVARYTAGYTPSGAPFPDS